MKAPAGVTALVLALALGVQARAEVVLEYAGRYDTQTTWHDHLMTVETIDDRYALVGSNLDIVIVDLEALPMGGTRDYLDRLHGPDVSNMVVGAAGHVYANLRRGGFAVVRFDEPVPGAPTLTLIDTVAEPDVYYEKMALAGDRLYVPAHAYGLRIFDVSSPGAPALVGSLTDGFDDAFAVAIAGDVAYVADGAGGLKIVDVADPANPVLRGGENLTSAAGTAEDVRVIDGDVYVACGGAGIAFYPGGDPAGRILYNTPIAAKQIARVGTRLAVADIGGVRVYDRATDGTLALAARESGQRRVGEGGGLTLRFWEHVAAWNDDRILVACWDSLDVYRIVESSAGAQPDVTVSTHRLRFAPAGGSMTALVRNDGAGPLTISSVQSTGATFSVTPTAAVLAAGESFELQVQYAGGAPGSARIEIISDDPDESPLPIEVFGDTSYLDPGEPATSFTLESWTFDHDADTFDVGMFDLDDHVGRIVYLHVFGLG